MPAAVVIRLPAQPSTAEPNQRPFGGIPGNAPPTPLCLTAAARSRHRANASAAHEKATCYLAVAYVPLVLCVR
jgi:hypothetical protein